MIKGKTVRAIYTQLITTITGTCSPSRRERAIISSKKSLEQTFLAHHKAQECYIKDIQWLRKIGKSLLINTIRLMIK
jgi:hypothetical protein